MQEYKKHWHLERQIKTYKKINISNMKKDEGTNYIDHRFPCGGMIKHIVVGKECIIAFDINLQLLYIVYND